MENNLAPSLVFVDVQRAVSSAGLFLIGTSDASVHAETRRPSSPLIVSCVRSSQPPDSSSAMGRSHMTLEIVKQCRSWLHYLLVTFPSRNVIYINTLDKCRRLSLYRPSWMFIAGDGVWCGGGGGWESSSPPSGPPDEPFKLWDFVKHLSSSKIVKRARTRM